MKSNKALINENILKWAMDRASFDVDSLSKKFTKISDWAEGKLKPTFTQAQKLAKTLQIPFGYFYLKNLPEELLPIPDLRTFSGVSQISPTFTELLNDVTRKQNWYKEYAIENQHLRIDSIGRFSVNHDFKEVASDIINKIKLKKMTKGNKKDFFDNSVRLIEDIGILVMRNSILGSNTHKSLELEEFRGFAIYDEYAPLIFINTRDTENARIFTLFHELAHLWISSSGISNSTLSDNIDININELFCNNVAAEILMPEKEFISIFSQENNTEKAIEKLEEHFCVSKFAVINKLYGLKLIDYNTYNTLYNTAKSSYLEFISRKKQTKKSGGGNSYVVARARVGKRFSSAVVYSTMEGKTLHRDAGHLLNINPSSISKYAQEWGIYL